MTEAPHTERHDPDTSTAEPDRPKNSFIFLVVLGSLVVLAAAVVAVDHFFGIAVRDEISRKVLAPESTQLRQLRAEEEAKLTRYQWVDRNAGVLRIPLERAMELTLAQWKDRPSGFVPGAAASSGTGAATPAGEKSESSAGPTPSKER